MSAPDDVQQLGLAVLIVYLVFVVYFSIIRTDKGTGK